MHDFWQSLSQLLQFPIQAIALWQLGSVWQLSHIPGKMFPTQSLQAADQVPTVHIGLLGVHEPRLQNCSGGHTAAQPGPQASSRHAESLHSLLQTSPGHLHVPLEQVSPARQVFPHVPQLLRSLSVSMHVIVPPTSHAVPLHTQAPI